MTSNRRSRRFDRRAATRRTKHIRGLVGRKGTPPQKCENAVIEEMGRGGLRIRSGAPLDREDSLILYVGEEQKPLGAKVVWVKKEGVIEKRTSGKPGSAFVAGCHWRFQEPKPQPRRAAKKGRVDHASISIRCAFYGGALGLAGILAYAAVSLVQMLG